MNRFLEIVEVVIAFWLCFCAAHLIEKWFTWFDGIQAAPIVILLLPMLAIFSIFLGLIGAIGVVDWGRRAILRKMGVSE